MQILYTQSDLQKTTLPYKVINVGTHCTVEFYNYSPFFMTIGLTPHTSSDTKNSGVVTTIEPYTGSRFPVPIGITSGTLYVRAQPTAYTSVSSQILDIPDVYYNTYPESYSPITWSLVNGSATFLTNSKWWINQLFPANVPVSLTSPWGGTVNLTSTYPMMLKIGKGFQGTVTGSMTGNSQITIGQMFTGNIVFNNSGTLVFECGDGCEIISTINSSYYGNEMRLGNEVTIYGWTSDVINLLYTKLFIDAGCLIQWGAGGYNLNLTNCSVKARAGSTINLNGTNTTWNNSSVEIGDSATWIDYGSYFAYCAAKVEEGAYFYPPYDHGKQNQVSYSTFILKTGSQLDMHSVSNFKMIYSSITVEKSAYMTVYGGPFKTYQLMQYSTIQVEESAQLILGPSGYGYFTSWQGVVKIGKGSYCSVNNPTNTSNGPFAFQGVIKVGEFAYVTLNVGTNDAGWINVPDLLRYVSYGVQSSSISNAISSMPLVGGGSPVLTVTANGTAKLANPHNKSHGVIMIDLQSLSGTSPTIQFTVTTKDLSISTTEYTLYSGSALSSPQQVLIPIGFETANNTGNLTSVPMALNWTVGGTSPSINFVWSIVYND